MIFMTENMVISVLNKCDRKKLSFKFKINMKTASISTNEKVIREVYRTAEVRDTKAFVSLFTDDGYFWDVSAGVKYYGNDIGKTVDIYSKAFPICIVIF